MDQVIIIKQNSIEDNEKSPIHAQQNRTSTRYTIYSEKGEIEITHYVDKSVYEMKSIKGDLFNGVQKFESLHDAIKDAKQALE